MTLQGSLRRWMLSAAMVVVFGPLAVSQTRLAARGISYQLGNGQNSAATNAGTAAAQAGTPAAGGTQSAAPTASPADKGTQQPTFSPGANTPRKPPVYRPSGVNNSLNPGGLPPLNGSGIQLQGVPGSSVPWSIIILLTGLTLIPSLLLCVTPFARLLIVFHFLRQALGLQTTPSNQTLIGLSLVLTFFLMEPVGTQIYQDAIIPMQSGQITAMIALERGEGPMRKFMSHHVREKDVQLFVDLAKEPRPTTPDDLSMRVLLPAYILSELKAGFQIGTVLFLPFLIVDMVVASITTSVGMLQLPPVVISTPLKLLLFLMVDGWHLLIGSLMRSFN
jgi:flagellar biosynthetic protein FliP